MVAGFLIGLSPSGKLGQAGALGNCKTFRKGKSFSTDLVELENGNFRLISSPSKSYRYPRPIKVFHLIGRCLSSIISLEMKKASKKRSSSVNVKLENLFLSI